MSDSQPTKADITAIFKRLKSIPCNKQCFDCSASNPTWASVTYGVFLCIDCSAVHRSLGVHLTFIRSIQLDTSWTWLQLRAMQVGGNAAAREFFDHHNCRTTDAQQKYNSRAAQLYREKLHSAAIKALKLHGEKLHIDSSSSGDHDPKSPSSDTHVDFFASHVATQPLEDYSAACQLSVVTEPVVVGNGTLGNLSAAGPSAGPSVDAALSISPTAAVQLAETRVPTIGTRKPTGGKKSMGGKKGLGAQKVSTNFSEIESEVLKKETEREQNMAALSAQQALTAEQQEKKLASLKLAYQDLDVDEKKRGDKMKNMDPKKREQMERLGMGATGSRGVSHSVTSDMQTIKQDNPSAAMSRQPVLDPYHSRSSAASRGLIDDFEIIGLSRSGGPPKYNDNPFGLKSKSDSVANPWSMLDDKYQSSSVDDNFSTSSKDSVGSDRERSRKTFEVSDSSDAQKKFGSAKAISSDQFFGRNDPDTEMKSRLSKYEGSSSISSAELFGTGGGGSAGSGSSYEDVRSRSRPTYYDDGPDLSDLKEGVKQVAGRLSNLANGVFSSIQDNYG